MECVPELRCAHVIRSLLSVIGLFFRAFWHAYLTTAIRARRSSTGETSSDNQHGNRENVYSLLARMCNYFRIECVITFGSNVYLLLARMCTKFWLECIITFGSNV